MSSNQAPSPTPPWWFFLAGAVTALLLFTLGAASSYLYLKSQEQTQTPETATEMGLLAEAWAIIEKEFMGPLPSPTERTYGAIRGSIETLGDPYTYFVEPEPAVREQEQLQGHFGGIGARLELQEDGRIYLFPLIERPAARAGVQKDDILIAIDGQPLPQPADLDDATNRLRGEVGSVVRITVLRDGKELEFEIRREQIELPSVQWRRLQNAPEAGYIRIERFSALTDKELTEALAELSDVRYLALDLRGNPGGLLDAAVAVSGHFLDGGHILTERHADGSEKVYTASDGGDALEVKLAVLVDGGTASAAEIVAGALQDRERAILVGQQTYGKGSIQRIHRLSDNSALHVTFARWYTPKGHQIDEQGLTPDILVEEHPTEEQDPALNKALEYLMKD
ncbi:MAG: S41 family peptidase [Chloroflexi bacterium]|nr:S41 family peptidase [Chloroflexota bacterium]